MPEAVDGRTPEQRLFSGEVPVSMESEERWPLGVAMTPDAVSFEAARLAALAKKEIGQ